MPRKTRTSPASLLLALRRGEERPDLPRALVGEAAARVEAVDRHHVVAELARVADVARELVRVAPGRADLGQLGRTEVRSAGAEVRVAVEAAGLGEELGARDRLLVVREALLLGPLLHQRPPPPRRRPPSAVAPL